ncbi:MAG: TetR/AcrR family transcriptional regulator [bacterium]
MSPQSAIVPRKLPQQSRSEKRVREIMGAYRRLLQSGSKTSTHHIADEAGVPVSSIYQYFPNKEALAFALYQELAEQMLEELHRLYDGVSEDADWRAYLFDTPNMFLQDSDSLRLMSRLAPVMGSSKPLKSAQRKMLRDMRDLVIGLLRKLGSDWSDKALSNLSALLIEFSTAAYHHMDHQTEEDKWRSLRTLRLTGIAIVGECMEEPEPQQPDQ